MEQGTALMEWTDDNHPYIINHDSRDVVDRTRMHQAASNGQLLVLQSLIHEGSCVNWTVNGVTPLHDACQKGELDCVEAIVDANAQLNSMDIDWHTPLTRSCSQGHKECVQHLIQSGARLNIHHGERFSPLHCAVFSGCIDSTNLLLQAGAEVDKLDYNRSGTPLHAATNGHQTVCARALLQAGADVNAVRPTDNKTPLHVAASVSAPAEIVTLLLQHGAKIHDLDTEGKKAVDLAPMDSQAYGALKHYTENARLLSELCRECVHQHLILDESVKSLPLPERLKQFLEFKS